MSMRILKYNYELKNNSVSITKIPKVMTISHYGHSQSDVLLPVFLRTKVPILLTNHSFILIQTIVSLTPQLFSNKLVH